MPEKVTMIATLPYLEEKYREFNEQMFAGELPPVRLELSRARTMLGALTSTCRRTWWGRVERSDYRIRISTRFDLPEAELEDTLIHEMIHYYIAVNGLRDTSAHGRVFRQMMSDINRRFGRHITISHRMSPEERERQVDQKPRLRRVAIVQFCSGRWGVKVLPRDEQKQRYYVSRVSRSPQVQDIQVYDTRDPWFGRFPQSAALNVVYVRREDLEQHI